MVTKHTYKRFIRQRQNLPFRLQARDIEILELLAEYRFLTTYQILALQPRGIRNLRRRLQYMFHAGLINRPPRQHNYLKPQGPLVHALGNKGADVLTEKLGTERAKINWQSKNREAGYPYIEHTLMVSSFRVTLTLALRSLKNTNLITWRQGPTIKATVPPIARRVAIVPDGFFTLEHRGNLFHWFLEADRSTMTAKRMLRKMRTYWYWWKEDGHRQELGIPRFRVLILTISEARKENLRKLARDVDEQKRGSPMFLFGCQNSFAIESPDAILEEMWQTPVGDQWHSILSL